MSFNSLKSTRYIQYKKVATALTGSIQSEEENRKV